MTESTLILFTCILGGSTMRGTTPQQRAKALTTVLNKTYDPYGNRCNVIDILTDLRHLCDVKGWDFAELDRQAYDNYTVENVAGRLSV